MKWIPWRHAAVAAMLGVVPAGATLAQGAAPQPGAESQAPPAVRGLDSNGEHVGAPIPGRNSFTEAQAKARMQDQGVSQIGALHQDGQSIWRGTGMKDGKKVNVALDYQGNVFVQ